MNVELAVFVIFTPSSSFTNQRINNILLNGYKIKLNRVSF